MKRLREAEPSLPDEPVSTDLPAELWRSIVFFLTNERDYKALVLGVPTFGRYFLFYASTLKVEIMGHFGHVHRVTMTDPPVPKIYYEDWTRFGLYHALDKSAIKMAEGEEEWWNDGLLHRKDGPAIRRKEYSAWYEYGTLLKVVVRHIDDEFFPDPKRRTGHPRVRNERFDPETGKWTGAVFVSKKTGARGTFFLRWNWWDDIDRIDFELLETTLVNDD
jgi:hypothetical protein